MARLARDGQARPKRGPSSELDITPVPAARDRCPDGGAGSSRFGRAGSARPGRSPKYYSGTSLRRLVTRQGIPACRYRACRGTFVARRPPACLTWPGKRLCGQSWWLAPLLPLCRGMSLLPAPLPRAPALQPSAPSWRRDRQDHRREERWGGHHSRRSDDVRREDWRSSRAEGTDWRRDDGPARHVSPGAPPAAPMPASAPAKKKKKSKKKKAAAATPGGAGCVTPPGVPGAPEQEALDPRFEPSPGAPMNTMCISCSFYFMDAEIEEEAARPHLATVTLAPEKPTPDGLVISSDLIRDELAAYIGDFYGSEFAWEVTETAPMIFSVPFPSAELLRVYSHGPIRCPINQLMICVQAATAEPDPIPLPEKLMIADLASFEDDGPARIEILCPAPAEIDGLSLVFYFGSKGRRLTFELESPAPVVQLDPVPSGPEPGDGGLDEEGDSSE
ncbi:hypothetical protein ZWY2020_005594 [Hordeum vulgare]|nr:hypothetical protein ZWY2020_005594 [Hordeum vulgare]